MCAKNDLIRRKGPLRLAGELAIAESVTAKDSNYVDTFSLDFAFSFAAWLQQIKCTLGDINSLFADNILSLIAFIISYCLFADELVYALNRVIVVLIIILVDKTQLSLILGDVAAYTLLAGFIPTTKIRDPLLKKRCLDKGHDDFIHLVNCFRWKHYNFNIYVSLATDTLHLLLKGLTSTEQKAIIQQLIAVVSLLFILKAPFALHFIRAVCDLVILAQYKNIRMYRALDSICTRANSEAYYITIVKQFYSMINKKEKYIAYIRAFSKVLLFNNNRQINNTTRILSVPFKFYDLSTIICLVHLVPRDLPNLTTRTTMSYYVNNYID
ncbi:hypothetical protein HBH61_057850 [Parastagonospora nodorum]|nr:hypothetical protein HBH61_057850 [Parastagonospora nodorum]